MSNPQATVTNPQPTVTNHQLHRRYLYSTDNYVVAGALLAIGIVNCGVQNENDPAYALIYDYVANPDVQVRWAVGGRPPYWDCVGRCRNHLQAPDWGR
jgi:hypothetical protein